MIVWFQYQKSIRFYEPKTLMYIYKTVSIDFNLKLYHNIIYIGFDFCTSHKLLILT